MFGVLRLDSIIIRVRNVARILDHSISFNVPVQLQERSDGPYKYSIVVSLG